MVALYWNNHCRNNSYGNLNVPSIQRIVSNAALSGASWQESFFQHSYGTFKQRNISESITSKCMVFWEAAIVRHLRVSFASVCCKTHTNYAIKMCLSVVLQLHWLNKKSIDWQLYVSIKKLMKKNMLHFSNNKYLLKRIFFS